MELECFDIPSEPFLEICEALGTNPPVFPVGGGIAFVKDLFVFPLGELRPTELAVVVIPLGAWLAVALESDGCALQVTLLVRESPVVGHAL